MLPGGGTPPFYPISRGRNQEIRIFLEKSSRPLTGARPRFGTAARGDGSRNYPDRATDAVTDAHIAKAEFGAGVTSASRARRFVAATLRNWECAPMADAAVLLVNELVTNALIHARSSVEVLVRLLPGGLRVEVRDDSPRPPRLKTPTEDATGGRGMWLVDQMADTWGVEPAPDGKRVWFELAR